MVPQSQETNSHRQLDNIASPEPTLPPGSHLLWVCDGTDNDPDGGITNGVKRTQLEQVSVLKKMGYHVTVVYPKMPDFQNENEYLFARIKDILGYEGYDVPINPYLVWNIIKELKPDGIMIATLEGALGQATAAIHHQPRLVGLEQVIPYIASFTTRVDQQVALTINHYWQLLQTRINLPWIPPEVITAQHFEPLLSFLYRDAHRILVPTQTMLQELTRMGLREIEQRAVLWPRGVDQYKWHPPKVDEGNPYHKYDWFAQQPDLPIFIFYGRVAIEKNIESFLRSNDENAHMVVIGDGPYLEELKQMYSHVHFLGKMHGKELAAHVRFASVQAFPSLTDTFGNTLLEAGASGIPTVGFSGVPGPQDVITPGINGYLIEDESEMIAALWAALDIDKKECARDIVDRYSWEAAVRILLLNMPPTPFFNIREEGHQHTLFR
jgi:glycosyltransferase involved in cell wall biosynthesis